MQDSLRTCVKITLYFCFVIWKNNRLFDLKKIYLQELKPQFGENEASQMLNILIEYFFSLTRTQLALKPDFRLTESEMLSLHNAVKELKTNKPVQYITGETEFYGMKFFVNKSVLIPRQETEELVDLIVAREKEAGLKVLDIGTGSGCIAISLAKKLNQAEVTAIDVSAAALAVAKKNAEINEVSAIFLEEDILNPSQTSNTQFDIIVSNPPYVTLSEKKQMQPNVLEFEPHLALFVENENPLVFYKAILIYASENLKTGGRLYFEINESLGKDASELLETNGFKDIKIHPDINGKDRMLVALKSQY